MRFCDSCVMRGNDWRPQPPDPVAIETGWKPAYPGQQRIRCPKGFVFKWGREGSTTPTSDDGVVYQGCLKGGSVRDGTWVFYDEKRKSERTIVYRNDRVLHQSERSPANR